MRKSALGVVISLFVLTAFAPAAHAEKSSKAKASAKRHAHKKPVKHKAEPTHVRHASLHTREKPLRKTVATHGKRRAAYQHVAYTPSAPLLPPALTAGDVAGLNTTRDALGLKSNAAVVIDQNSSQVLFEKNATVSLPIASLTKLMTATIVVEAQQDMDEVLEITTDDIDREKNSSSRLRVGSRMTRANMLHIALMSSENRAASALGRNYPGGLPAFVAAMNAKARELGMHDTHYVDSTGLSSRNVASARDLAKLVIAAHRYPIIREYSTDGKYAVNAGGYVLQYMNSNRLVMNSNWDIGLQKTGYINEAGRCLVMQARIDERPVVMVFLDSKGKDSRLADAARIRRWLESAKPTVLTQVASHRS